VRPVAQHICKRQHLHPCIGALPNLQAGKPTFAEHKAGRREIMLGCVLNQRWGPAGSAGRQTQKPRAGGSEASATH
jgi:hypothetical protein